MSTPDVTLAAWFKYLSQFRDCASVINSDLGKLNCPDFANATIATWFNATEIDDFASCAASATKLKVDGSSIGASSTFESLLKNTAGFPDRYILVYMQWLAPAPYKNPPMNNGDFSLQKAVDVYPAVPPPQPPAPAGTLNPAWVTTNAGLAGIMGGCYSAAKQSALEKSVGDPAKLIADLVAEIVVFG